MTLEQLVTGPGVLIGAAALLLLALWRGWLVLGEERERMMAESGQKRAAFERYMEAQRENERLLWLSVRRSSVRPAFIRRARARAR